MTNPKVVMSRCWPDPTFLVSGVTDPLQFLGRLSPNPGTPFDSPLKFSFEFPVKLLSSLFLNLKSNTCCQHLSPLNPSTSDCK